jgi:hypothetical protein
MATDHIEKVGLQLWYYEQSEKLKQFTEAFLEQVNSIENDVEGILSSFELSSATGIFLDRIGLLVGELRQGKSDDSFRDAIYLRIAVNNSNGTVEDIYQILGLLLGSGTKIILSRTGKAVVSMYVQSPNITDELYELLQQILPVGVKVDRILYSDSGTPWTPTEKGAADFTSAILPEKGDLSVGVRIPCEIL